MNLEDRILEILMKEAFGEVSLEEKAMLSDFSSKSASNSAFIDENRSILGHLPTFEEDAASMFDVDSALIKVKSQLEPTAKIHTLKPKATTINYQKWAAAAMFLIGLATLAYTFMDISGVPESYVTTDSVETIQLSDGSEVILNKNSSLTLSKDFGSELRDMQLEGEAFFKVQHNQNQPFTVKVDGLEVEVLGTEFNIDATANHGDIAVFVEEGKVKVSALHTGTKVLLTAGQSSSFDKMTRALLKDKAKKYNSISWLNKKLRFENASLSQVIEEIEDHFGIIVELKNNALSDCKYTSIFNGAKADEVLETLSAVFDLQLMKEGNNTFELTGGNCN